MRGRGGKAGVPATVDGRAHRTPRCRRGSEPQRGSRSQAGGPSQRQRPLGACCWQLEGTQRTVAAGGRKRRAARELLQQPDGRESPRTDFSGRTGASGGDLTGWCSKRRSIFATVPAALNLPACPPRLPGAPNPLGRNLPCTTPSLPGYHPDTPTPTPPSVRLPRTMPCCGTPRVCVLECPPLGRPSPKSWSLSK